MTDSRNARLIGVAHLLAAAPYMLKVLKTVLDEVAWSKSEPGLQLIVRAAIDKAEGRT